MGKITKTAGELLEVNRELSKIIDDLYQIILQQESTQDIRASTYEDMRKAAKTMEKCQLPLT